MSSKLAREGEQIELEEDRGLCALKMLRLERFFERIDSRNDGRDGVGGISLSTLVVVWEMLVPER